VRSDDASYNSATRTCSGHVDADQGVVRLEKSDNEIVALRASSCVNFRCSASLGAGWRRGRRSQCEGREFVPLGSHHRNGDRRGDFNCVENCQLPGDRLANLATTASISNANADLGSPLGLHPGRTGSNVQAFTGAMATDVDGNSGRPSSAKPASRDPCGQRSHFRGRDPNRVGFRWKCSRGADHPQRPGVFKASMTPVRKHRYQKRRQGSVQSHGQCGEGSSLLAHLEGPRCADAV
jgi:hypothetical protein